ncbi:MAG: PKD domain-containing protein, partial [Bacteroidota bacterium]
NAIIDTRYNFIKGNNPSKWGQGARSFKTLEYIDLYECVDVEVFAEQYWLKYDILIHPGAVADSIKMKYDGLTDIQLKDGRLHLKTSLNEIIESIPYAYQLIDGDTVVVETQYRLDHDEVSFAFPCGFDEDYTLIIDPVLIFSTFSGSTADNFGYTAAFDDEGNLYSGGIVFSTGFPVTLGPFQSEFSGGLIDLGILKLDSTGSNLIYATYIGGDSEEVPQSMVVNQDNELIIFGSTSSPDFPTTSSAYDTSFNGGNDSTNLFGFLPYENGADIYLAKLSSSGGGLSASTFLGGADDDGIIHTGDTLEQNYGDQFRGDVNVDELGNIYLVTTTRSNDFFSEADSTTTVLDRSIGGKSDAIVLKTNTELSQIIWGTYLGGDGEDAGYSIKFDSQKNVYVCGGTEFSNNQFPTTVGSLLETHQGDIDGFVTKISSAGDSIMNSTFIGTAVYDQTYFLDLDVNEDVYLFGQTRGNYPVVGNVYNNPNSGQFVHKITNSLDATVFSTVFGSGTREPNISPTAFLVNECDNLYLSGWGGAVNNRNSGNRGTTNDLPITPNAFQTTTDGSDFYLMSLSADGSRLLYATYFGANGDDPTLGEPGNGGDHVDGGTSRFDKRGIVYQSVCSCGGQDDNFPTTPGSWSTVNLGVNTSNVQRCNNAMFKFDIASLVAQFRTNTVNFDNPGVSVVCFPDDIVFQNRSIGGEEFEWDFGDGTGLFRQDTTFIVHNYTRPGTYTVKLIARDQTTCIGVDSTTQRVEVIDPPFGVGDDGLICEGTNYQLQAFGPGNFEWTNTEGVVISNSASVIVSPDTTTQYFVDFNFRGCSKRDTVNVEVLSLDVQFEIEKIGDCFDLPSFSLANTGESADSYIWNFGDGLTSEDEELIYKYEEEGIYTITLTGRREFCEFSESVAVDAFELKVPNVFTPDIVDGENDTFIVRSQEPVDLKILNRWGKVIYENSEYIDQWDGENHPAGVYYYEVTTKEDVVCRSWLHLVR